MDDKLRGIKEYAASIKRLSALKHHPQYGELVQFTSFLPTEATSRQRLWHAEHGQQAPVCKCCGGVVSWRKDLCEYSTFCSSKCAHTDIGVLEKTASTVRTRYGVDVIGSAAHTKEKRERTNIARYGHTNSFWSGRTPDEVSIQYKEARNKHLANATQVQTLVDDGLTQLEIGRVLGISQPRVSVLLSHLDITTVSSQKTSAFQRDICQTLEDFGVYYETNKQLIPPFDVDIYCPDLDLAIEANGVFWHRECSGKDRRYHLNKTEMCNKIGVRLIHIYDTEWFARKNICVSRLRRACNHHTNVKKVMARKCDMVSVSSTEASQFLLNNHIQGSCVGSSVALGAVHDGQLVAVMTLGKPRYAQEQFELLRFASKLDTSVVGIASRLFRHFTSEFSPASVVTYSDRRWAVESRGSVYNTMGFEYVGVTSPNYKYIHIRGDTSILHNRQQFQKHKLASKLAIYDPTLSEWENMQANGYDRIWDCGNTKWVWNRK